MYCIPHPFFLQDKTLTHTQSHLASSYVYLVKIDFQKQLVLKLSENSFEKGISSVSNKVAFNVLLESSNAKKIK